MSKSLPIGRSLLLSALVSLGIGVAWLVVVAWTIGTVQTAGFTQQTYENLYVRLDGEPRIYRYIGGFYAGQEVLTLDGQPTSGDDQQQLLYSGYIQPQRSTFANPLAAKSWQLRLAAASDGRTPATYWYLVHDGRTNGRVYGVGYNAITKRIVGYFGRQGFSDVQPPRDEWFEVAGEQGLSEATPSVVYYEPNVPQSALILLAEGKLWSFNTQTREVKTLLDAPRATTIGQVWRALDKLPPKQPGVMPLPAQYLTRQKLVLRSADDCLLVDPETGDKITFILPASLRKVGFAGYELADGNLLLISWPGTIEKLGQRLVWLAPDGTVVRERSVQLAQLARSADGYAAIGWLAVVAAPLPPAHAAFTLLAPVQMLESGATDTYAAGLTRMLRETWPSTLAAFAIAGVAATLAYRRQRRYGLSHAVAWAVFVFVFGIPGWIAYRFHGTWPVLEDCPACGEPAPRDRETCLDCGAAFPPPPLKGIEVFA